MTPLKLRTLIAAHTGYEGQRGIQVTKASVSDQFWWENMKKDEEDFVGSRLHCLATASGRSSEGRKNRQGAPTYNPNVKRWKSFRVEEVSSLQIESKAQIVH